MTDPSPRFSWNTPAVNAAWFAGAVTSIVATWLFGFIYTHTHHRPLGAATLAVLVLCTFYGVFAVALRLRIGARVARVSLALAAAALGLLAVF